MVCDLNAPSMRARHRTHPKGSKSRDIIGVDQAILQHSSVRAHLPCRVVWRTLRHEDRYEHDRDEPDQVTHKDKLFEVIDAWCLDATKEAQERAAAKLPCRVPEIE